MKKTFALLAVALLTLGNFAGNAAAQVPVPSPDPQVGKLELDADGAPVALPIGSYGQLKSFAFERISWGQISMSTPSIINAPDTATSFSDTIGPDQSPDAFIQQVLGHTFSYNMFDTRDWINVYTGFYTQFDSQHGADLLFSGFYMTKTWPQPALGGVNGFSIQDMELHLSDRIALPAGSITNATIYYRDEYGNFQYGIPLEVNNGWIYFLTKYAGRDGQVLAYAKKPGGGIKEVVYDLAGFGGRIQPVAAVGMVKGRVDNYFETTITAQPNTVRYANIAGSVHWKTTPPVLRVKVLEGAPGQWAVIEVACALFDDHNVLLGAPDQVSVRRAGTRPDQAVMIIPNTDGRYRINLAPGIHYIAFDHDEYFNANREAPDYQLDGNFGKPPVGGG